MSLNKVIISGGGTGGHIYPAIAIASALKKKNPNMEILFVGALGKMEMEKVPQAGFPIVGLQISGFNRKKLWKNVGLPFKLFLSEWKAFRILRNFKPQLVIGVGGYASGPTLQMANWLKIPTLIQEQNSFPGKTNKILAKKATSICVAYDGLDQFFPPKKIFKTGNPVRQDILDISVKKDEGMAFYNLDAHRKTIFIMGGSLGARSINQAVLHAMNEIESHPNVQVLWQCGKGYYEDLRQRNLPSNVKLLPFIERMDLAYASADIIVSRAGATSISELCLVGKPTILVPSPNVAEDHQTKNARALSDRSAAILLPDKEVITSLWLTTELILKDSLLAVSLAEEIKKMALPKATENIVALCEKSIQP